MGDRQDLRRIRAFLLDLDQDDQACEHGQQAGERADHVVGRPQFGRLVDLDDGLPADEAENQIGARALRCVVEIGIRREQRPGQIHIRKQR